MWQLHNRLTYSALQFLHFHMAKQPLLHGKNMPFAAQNSLFCIARQWVLEFKITGSIIYWKSCSYKAGDFYGFISALKAYSLRGK